MKASVNTADGRHTLTLERRLDHPLEKVWRAISQPEHLSAWYPGQINSLPLEAEVEIEFFDEDGGKYPGVVSQVDPPHVLAFRDVLGDEVRMELAEDGEGTLLTFTHSFLEAIPPGQHAAGWHSCFEALDAVLDQREVPALGFDEALRDHYQGVLGQTE